MLHLLPYKQHFIPNFNGSSNNTVIKPTAK